MLTGIPVIDLKAGDEVYANVHAGPARAPRNGARQGDPCVDVAGGRGLADHGAAADRLRLHAGRNHARGQRASQVHPDATFIRPRTVSSIWRSAATCNGSASPRIPKFSVVANAGRVTNEGAVSGAQADSPRHGGGDLRRDSPTKFWPIFAPPPSRLLVSSISVRCASCPRFATSYHHDGAGRPANPHAAARRRLSRRRDGDELPAEIWRGHPPAAYRSWLRRDRRGRIDQRGRGSMTAASSPSPCFADRLVRDAERGEWRDGETRYLLLRQDSLMGMFRRLAPSARDEALAALAAAVAEAGGRSAGALSRDDAGRDRRAAGDCRRNRGSDSAGAFGHSRSRPTENCVSMSSIARSPRVSALRPAGVRRHHRHGGRQSLTTILGRPAIAEETRLRRGRRRGLPLRRPREAA